MGHLSRVPVAVIVAGSSLFGRAGLPPIPAEVWAMKEDPAKGIVGAVVLEDRVSFRNTHVEYVFRVRILSEGGRSAAELPAFSEDCYGFEGRTVYPDGRQVVFNGRKDFQRKTLITVGAFESKQTKFIPPGVTGNCVVELHWKESADHDRMSPLPKRNPYFWELILSNPFFTEKAVIELPMNFPYAFRLLPTRSQVPVVTEKGIMRTFTFSNMPSQEELPFSLDSTRDRPRFLAYYQPDPLKYSANKGGDGYWKAAVDVFFRPYFSSELSTGKNFRALSQELSQGLPTEPFALAHELMLRLDARIRNLSRLTHAEKAQRKEGERIDSQNLEQAAKLGETTGTGMGLLYLELLRAHGIQPLVALVADRDQRLFSPAITTLFQFTHQIYGIEGPKGVLWVDPALRYAAPGVVHPDYQGSTALVINTKDWTFTPRQMPMQPAAMNQLRWTYELSPGEGEDRFTAKAEFSGIPELVQRYRFLELEQAEQNRELKEDFEQRLKSATLSKCEVSNAQNPKLNTSFSIEGRIESESEGRRLLSPFPGMKGVLTIPDVMPTRRTDPILIPYARVHQATSRIHVPTGWKASELAPLDQQNEFGRVRWAIALEGSDAVVTFRVDLAGVYRGPEKYEELKQLLAWIQEATNRQIELKRVP